MLKDKDNIPQHVAIIMDGNGRWAKQKGQYRAQGHESGVTAVREAVESCVELGIKYLTLYTFSIENWNRPKEEVDALMELFVNTINGEKPMLIKNNIRLNAIGNLEALPAKCGQDLYDTMAETAGNAACTLTLALSYGARWEITEAARQLAAAAAAGTLKPEEINDAMLAGKLTTKGMPDPELLIRTGGELRVSNFLLWQIAYTELYFTDVLWPDFSRAHLIEALNDYAGRERRFGKISEQIQ